MTRNQLLEMFPAGDPHAQTNPNGRRLFDPISAIVGGVTSIAGSIIGGNAAESAAKTQANAAKEAGQVAQTQANAGAAEITGAIPTANAAVTGAATNANALLASTNATNQQTLQPAIAAGATATNELQGLSQQQFVWNPATDPSYQFALTQGMKALQNSAAAKGMAQGGEAVKATEQYAQNYASQQYQNAFQNFQTNRANQASILNPIVSAGSTAQGQSVGSNNFYAGTASGNTMGAGTFVGSNTMAGTTAAAQLQQQGANAYANALTQAGNAQAAGTVGAANAWSNGLTGASNAVQNAMLLNMINGDGGQPDTNGPNVQPQPWSYVPPSTAVQV